MTNLQLNLDCGCLYTKYILWILISYELLISDSTIKALSLRFNDFLQMLIYQIQSVTQRVRLSLKPPGVNSNALIE